MAKQQQVSDEERDAALLSTTDFFEVREMLSGRWRKLVYRSIVQAATVAMASSDERCKIFSVRPDGTKQELQRDIWSRLMAHQS